MKTMDKSDQVTRASNRSWLRIGLILIWLMIVLALYFVIHKPADNAQIIGLAGWLPGLLIVGLMTIVASMLGYQLLGRHFNDNSRSILSLGLGLGVFSLAGLVFGMIGAMRSEIAWSLIGLAAIWSVRSIRAWWIDLGQLLRSILPTTRFARLAAAYCVFVLVIALLQSLAPPTAWDSLAYHLQGPEVYLKAGRITQSIDNPYLGFPQFGELLFLFARVLGAANPAMLHWIFGASAALLIAGQAQRVWNKNVGWIAAAIFLSAETVVLEAGSAYVDLMFAFYVVAAYAAVTTWRSDRSTPALIAAGVFNGLAMATKYYAAPISLALTLIVLIRSDGDRFRSVFTFIIVSMVVTAAWYLKTWITTGNPVYPFVFGGVYWDAIRAQSFSRAGTGLPFLQLLTAPWDATIWGVEGKLGYTATLGPLWLMLTPIALLGWRWFDRDRRRALMDALIIFAFAYAGWLMGLATSAALLQSRLLLPVLPLLAITAAGAFQVFQDWDQPRLSLQRVAVALVSIVLVATAIKISLDFGGSGVLNVLSGGQSNDKYLTDRLGWYYTALQAANDLGGDARVLFLWEPRSLYCHVDCRPDALLDNWWHARRTIGSIDQIADRWQTDGVQYVLLYQQGYHAAIDLKLDASSLEDQQALTDLIEQRLDLVRDFGGAYQLYRWRKVQP